MTSMRVHRWGIAAGVAMLVILALSTVSPAADSTDDPSLLGRFSVVSDAGGAVWSFQPGGGLMVVGPGDLLAVGTWAPGPGSGEFDAELDVVVTGQVLSCPGGSLAGRTADRPLRGRQRGDLPTGRDPVAGGLAPRWRSSRPGRRSDTQSDPSARRLPPARLGRCRVGGLGSLLGQDPGEPAACRLTAAALSS